MSEKKKVYVVGATNLYDSHGSFLKWFTQVDDMTKCDLVIFRGGADVNPSLYGQAIINQTMIDKTRDYMEMEAYKKALLYKIPMLGICRGAQFLTVMNGGQLIQHVTGHERDHEMSLLYDPEGKTDDSLISMMVTSTHHQMMAPMLSLKDEDYMILGWSKTPLSTEYLIEKEGVTTDISGQLKELNKKSKLVSEKDFIIEPEMVFYQKTNCLCMQFHPEYHAFTQMKTNDGRKSLDIIEEFINQYIFNAEVRVSS